ncbi:MAG: nucleotide pyrophosphohydrolase [Candidatus Thioglobus sp.]|jgi:NTP pyrophosphatase (non-canonical NTP hydrolase)|nr:nucleotide pyrophosphohydrolase [Candidatus Thioglobus sp.]
MNILEIQKQLEEFANDRNWNQFHNPKNLVMALSVEASELVEIFQWLTPEQAEFIMESDESEHVKEEIADVLIYLFRLADKLDINLEEAVSEKIIKNSKKHLIKS